MPIYDHSDITSDAPIEHSSLQFGLPSFTSTGSMILILKALPRWDHAGQRRSTCTFVIEDEDIASQLHGVGYEVDGGGANCDNLTHTNFLLRCCHLSGHNAWLKSQLVNPLPFKHAKTKEIRMCTDIYRIGPPFTNNPLQLVLPGAVVP